MKLTKFEKQFKTIQKIGITKLQFKHYYTKIRKAKKKLERLNKNENFIGRKQKTFSLNKLPRSIKEYKYYTKIINQTLKKDFRILENDRSLSMLRVNLKYLFNDQKLTDKFMKLKKSEINEFFKKNKDLEIIRWASPNTSQQQLKFIQETKERFNLRLDYFLKGK